MKKVRSLIIILLLVWTLVGCTQSVNNEIYNKSYHVSIDLEEFEDLIVAAVERVAPAVLGVSNYERGIFLDYQLAGTGSGVVYECKAVMKDGTTIDDCSETMDSNDVEIYQYFLVTNKHVVVSDPGIRNRIRVYDGDEDILLDAEVVQFDDKVDVAVVSFEYEKYIHPVTFADSDLIKRGSFAIALGNPAGYDFYGTATFGIISSPKRYLSDDTDGDGINDWDAEYIQHDVAINPGNSGGALINIQGELIGINTLKLVDSKIDNMGFAIPSNVVKDLVAILQTGEKPQRYTLGINVYTVRDILYSEDTFLDFNNQPIVIPESLKNGMFVLAVNQGGLADGHLLANDIIVLFDGKEIRYSYEFRAMLGNVTTGDTVLLTVYRNGELVVIEIKFE